MKEKVQKEEMNNRNEEQLRNFHDTYERLTRTNVELAEKICQLENEIQYYKQQVADQSDRERQLRRAIENAERKIYSSIRYQTGDAFFNALHLSKDTIKLPAKLFRLWKKSRNVQSNIDTTSNISNGKDYSNDEYLEAKSAIVQENKKYLRAQGKLQNVGMVSIIIINRDGLHNLKTLFESFLSTKYYDNIEFIIVDNASKDDSINFLKELQNKFKIQIIQNEINKSFSEANNQGVQLATGEYLLFLNNDIEVTDGWLDELLYTLINEENAGAVGAKLVYPLIPEGSINFGKSLKIQHTGIGFSKTSIQNKPFVRPYNLGNGEEVFKEDETVQQKAAVTAAVLLVKKEVFELVGGFDEGYIYGYEDVDLCLKIHRAGYKNYYCPSALLFHYEFGTQSKDNQSEVARRRAANADLFKTRWMNYLLDEMLHDKLAGKNIFTEASLSVAFVVTEAGEEATAGDYFTALEFATAMKKNGITVKYLCRRGSGDWYNVGHDVDVLIAMIDAYDVTKIKNYSPDIVTIAWMRNQFERWCCQTYFYNYKLVLASSKLACDYVLEHTGREALLFPIASNAERFLSVANSEEQSEDKEKYSSDYVFTGSYWNVRREIMDIIQPQKIPFQFKVFGANWEKTDCFKDSAAGFINYSEMPLVYKYTKIVVDDANNVTKEFGSVNSRVFDALAAGRLVLTNGVKGAQDTFEGKLPFYEDRESFEKVLLYYMENEKEYQLKVKELQEYVLQNHTYEIRVEQLLEILRNQCIYKSKSIAIMMPVPCEEVAYSWGDYHFAVSMRKYLERMGYNVELRYLNEWYKPFLGKTVIVLRGLSEYIPRNEHLNIMWNISHPDMVTENEYRRYDKVYICSEYWVEKLKESLGDKVEVLLQCTDAEQFECDFSAPKEYELLFVGNSRFVFRKVLKDLLPTEYDLSVFGENWEGIIDSKYIKGNHVPNDKLDSVYGSAKILLNDHWDDMRENGFISNRIFDGLASGAFIISDNVYGMKDAVGDCVVVYDDADELKQKISYYLQNTDEMSELARKGHELVLEKHTMKQRMETIVDYIVSELN